MARKIVRIENQSELETVVVVHADKQADLDDSRTVIDEALKAARDAGYRADSCTNPYYSGSQAVDAGGNDIPNLLEKGAMAKVAGWRTEIRLLARP